MNFSIYKIYNGIYDDYEKDKMEETKEEHDLYFNEWLIANDSTVHYAEVGDFNFLVFYYTSFQPRFTNILYTYSNSG